MTDLPSPARLFQRLNQLASLTDEPGSICRTFLSPAMRQANALVGGWMQEAGCEVTVDGWGNLIGHLPGPSPAAPTLLIGSHLDTVRNAGKFDGPLGVLIALECIYALSELKFLPPFHLDILGFSDEEGTRFHTAYLGSKALTGLIEPKDLDLRDAQGIRLGDAVASFQGVDSLALPRPRYRPDQLLGYLEVHIEQGPVLQDLDQPLGIVDAIAAQNRYVFTFAGCAGHAGTTPMNLRHDALAGAAEFVLAVEALGRRVPGLVATVGQLQVGPDVSNVIPDKVRLSVDIRHAELRLLEESCSQLADTSQKIASQRGLEVNSSLIQATQPVACAPRLIRLWDRVLDRGYQPPPHLISGAGHDGVILSQLTEVSMLFVRCKDGLSHHPAEETTPTDAAAAIAALVEFLQHFHER
jgi:allantoate deiminase